MLLLQENVDALIECVKKDIGFSQGKPVAAFTIYKCLIQWKSFEAERTSVFDRLIQMIGSAIEVFFPEENQKGTFIIFIKSKKKLFCRIKIIMNTWHIGYRIRLLCCSYCKGVLNLMVLIQFVNLHLQLHCLGE